MIVTCRYEKNDIYLTFHVLFCWVEPNPKTYLQGMFIDSFNIIRNFPKVLNIN